MASVTGSPSASHVIRMVPRAELSLPLSVHHVGHPCPHWCQSSAHRSRPAHSRTFLLAPAGWKCPHFLASCFRERFATAEMLYPRRYIFSFFLLSCSFLSAQKSTSSFQQSDPACIRTCLFIQREFLPKAQLLFLNLSFSSFLPSFLSPFFFLLVRKTTTSTEFLDQCK